MAMHLILATNNSHKIVEMRGIVPDWLVSGPQDLGINFTHEETGLSFAENALGKAQTLWNLVQATPDIPHDVLVLADDSGLSVDALGGEPGLHSARFGRTETEPPLDDRGRYELLLRRLQGKPNRGAHFVCCLALVSGPERFVIVQETWDGLIATSATDGGHGFGYDPVFWLPEYNCTVACLPAEIKNRVSHRAKAMKSLGCFLRQEALARDFQQ